MTDFTVGIVGEGVRFPGAESRIRDPDRMRGASCEGGRSTVERRPLNQPIHAPYDQTGDTKANTENEKEPDSFNIIGMCDRVDAEKRHHRFDG